MDGREKNQVKVSSEPSIPQSPHTANLHKTQSPIIVTHVPVSIGSSDGSSSTNSSISTDASTHSDHLCHGCEDSKGNDRQSEITRHRCLSQDSFNESSPQVPDHGRETSVERVKSPSDKKPIVPNINGIPMLPSSSFSCKRATVSSSMELPAKKPRLADDIPSPKPQQTPAPPVLLARDYDDVVLNPLHVFVRSQIEVFTATKADLALPAPGRKHPIKLHQVGLRCIHCRDVPSRKRVKRAVCYPSSVGRIYHSVSDMKFDHFSHCQDLPEDARAKFEALKAEGKRSSDKKGRKSLSYASSTAQYYHDAAVQMGMKDSRGGIFMASGQCASAAAPPTINLQTGALLSPTEGATNAFAPLPTVLTLPVQLHLKNISMTQKVPHPSAVQPKQVKNERNVGSVGEAAVSKSPLGRLPIPLASPADKDYLNQLHCFVRRHVEIFTADNEDIAAPAPGRRNRVLLGQVGIRCIHCAKLPLKDRVKRAVCYPPSVAGIYHSVSNMKFDHFAICRGLPTRDREEFASLKSTCARRGTAGNSASRTMASSTAQYYHNSALQLGLVDTPTGIRVSDPKPIGEDRVSVAQNRQRMIPAGLSVLMIAATQAV